MERLLQRLGTRDRVDFGRDGRQAQQTDNRVRADLATSALERSLLAPSSTGTQIGIVLSKKNCNRYRREGHGTACSNGSFTEVSCRTRRIHRVGIIVYTAVVVDTATVVYENCPIRCAQKLYANRAGRL